MEEAGDGIVVRVHVQPGASRTSLVGRHGDAIRLRVAAPPVGGRANDAVVAFFAGVLGVPRRAVSVVTGATTRRKRVRVAGAGIDEAVAALRAALDARPH
jgi:uncharacterized protein (TIGR00251 family)